MTGYAEGMANGWNAWASGNFNMCCVNPVHCFNDVGRSAAYRYTPHDSTLSNPCFKMLGCMVVSLLQAERRRGVMHHTQRWHMGGRHMGEKLIPTTQQLAICTAPPCDWQPDVCDNVLHVRLIQPRCLGMRLSPSTAAPTHNPLRQTYKLNYNVGMLSLAQSSTRAPLVSAVSQSRTLKHHSTEKPKKTTLLAQIPQHKQSLGQALNPKPFTAAGPGRQLSAWVASMHSLRRRKSSTTTSHEPDKQQPRSEHTLQLLRTTAWPRV